VIAFAALAALGAVWSPLVLALPLLVLSAGVLLVQASLGGWAAHSGERGIPSLGRRALTGTLFALQPLARLSGRLRNGLAPWRRHGGGIAFPRPHAAALWSEHWRSLDDRLRGLELTLREESAVVLRGGEFDRWDLCVRGGLLGSVRLRAAVEEHGHGRQLVRFRSWPRPSRASVVAGVVFAVLAAVAWVDNSVSGAAAVAGLAAFTTLVAVHDCAVATGVFLRALRRNAERAELLALEDELSQSMNGRPSQARHVGAPAPLATEVPELAPAGTNGHPPRAPLPERGATL
jgi:hypothetical protein